MTTVDGIAELEAKLALFQSRYADELERAEDERTRRRHFETAAARVLALHSRRPFDPFRDLPRPGTIKPDQCDHCRRDWPCPTIEALDGAETTQEHGSVCTYCTALLDSEHVHDVLGHRRHPTEITQADPFNRCRRGGGHA